MSLTYAASATVPEGTTLTLIIEADTTGDGAFDSAESWDIADGDSTLTAGWDTTYEYRATTEYTTSDPSVAPSLGSLTEGAAPEPDPTEELIEETATSTDAGRPIIRRELLDERIDSEEAHLVDVPKETLLEAEATTQTTEAFSEYVEPLEDATETMRDIPTVGDVQPLFAETAQVSVTRLADKNPILRTEATRSDGEVFTLDEFLIDEHLPAETHGTVRVIASSLDYPVPETAVTSDAGDGGGVTASSPPNPQPMYPAEATIGEANAVASTNQPLVEYTQEVEHSKVSGSVEELQTEELDVETSRPFVDKEPLVTAEQTSTDAGVISNVQPLHETTSQSADHPGVADPEHLLDAGEQTTDEPAYVVRGIISRGVVHKTTELGESTRGIKENAAGAVHETVPATALTHTWGSPRTWFISDYEGFTFVNGSFIDDTPNIYHYTENDPPATLTLREHTFETDGQPYLTKLVYNRRHATIRAEVTGSPGTASEETVSAELRGREVPLGWTRSHSKFRVRLVSNVRALTSEQRDAGAQEPVVAIRSVSLRIR